MKKIVLIVILILNTAGLGVTVINLYSYITGSDYGRIEPKEDEFSDREDPKKPEPAQAKVSSHPSRAKVFIDGYLKGRTPVEFSVVSAKSNGKFLLTLVKPGYKKEERNIDLRAGEEKEFNIELQKIDDETN
ncbi:MAG: PEGA domain-containing protein [Elusimicrobiota bacterium]